MDLLKKENWGICLFLNLITGGIFYFVIAYFIKCYNKDAWYKKWQYWVFGTLCLVFPVFIMLMIFMIQINCQVASKLNVPGEKIYNTPYTWIILFIIPVLGWTLLIIMSIYVFIWPNIKLAQGEGEKYLK